MLSHFFEEPARIREIRSSPSGALITYFKTGTPRSPLVDTFDQRNTLFAGRAEASGP